MTLKTSVSLCNIRQVQALKLYLCVSLNKDNLQNSWTLSQKPMKSFLYKQTSINKQAKLQLTMCLNYKNQTKITIKTPIVLISRLNQDNFLSKMSPQDKKSLTTQTQKVINGELDVLFGIPTYNFQNPFLEVTSNLPVVLPSVYKAQNNISAWYKNTVFLSLRC